MHTAIATPHPDNPPSEDSVFCSLDPSVLDSLPPLLPEPVSKLFGPAVGMRHPEYGLELPTARGHLRLVLHEAGKRIMYGQGAGFDEFEVDGIDGPPQRPGVVEMLAIVVHEITGEKTGEKPQAPVEQGQRFLDTQIRAQPMALGEKNCAPEGNLVEVGITFWRVEGEPNRFHFVIGAAKKKQQDEKIDIGIRRTASWQLCYTQVDAASGEVLFSEMVPGTFIIRTGCSEVEDRKKKTKNMENERKGALIDLVARHGHAAQAAALRKRGAGNRKRALGEILSCASGLGMPSALLAKTIGDTEQYVCKLVRDWAARPDWHQPPKTVTRKRARVAAPSEDKPENRSKKVLCAMP